MPAEPPQGFAMIPRSLLHDPSVPADAKMVYVVLSSHAGGNHMAWPSRKRIAEVSGLSESTVKRQLHYLIEHGYVAVEERRNGDGVSLTNAYRLMVGSAPTPEETRGSVRTPGGSQRTPRGSHRPGEGVTQTRGGGHTDPRTIVTERESPNESPRPDEPARADVEKLCTRLADAIEHNGSKRPTVSDRWRVSCRLLLDRDGRTVEQVERAIDWCQSDDFWRANILSMPKLREKYDQLRLAAKRAQAREERPAVVQSFRDRQQAAIDASMAWMQ
jgi:hypothetical protein